MYDGWYIVRIISGYERAPDDDDPFTFDTPRDHALTQKTADFPNPSHDDGDVRTSQQSQRATVDRSPRVPWSGPWF